VDNLTHRLQGNETVALEIEGPAGPLNQDEVGQKLQQVAGVTRVQVRESRDNRLALEVESAQGRAIRPDLARAVVQAGWNLTELRPVSVSLENVFLELTAAEKAETAEAAEPAGGAQ
jgi:ABC-2 type transport system ATP-binding protein